MLMTHYTTDVGLTGVDRILYQTKTSLAGYISHVRIEKMVLDPLLYIIKLNDWEVKGTGVNLQKIE